MGIRAHAADAGRRQLFELGNQFAIFIEQLLRLLCAHPFFENRELFGLLLHVRHRNLVCSPEAFQPVAGDFCGRTPTFRRTQHNHRPAGARGDSGAAGFVLGLPDLRNALLHGGRHRLVHAVGVGTFHEVRRPSITAEQVFHFFMADASEQGRIVDLVAVEVQNREDRAVANGVQELADVPGGRQRPGFRFPISYDRRDDEVGVVERGAARVRKYVAELASFMD